MIAVHHEKEFQEKKCITKNEINMTKICHLFFDDINFRFFSNLQEKKF